jgi:hypothetical protein
MNAFLDRLKLSVERGFAALILALPVAAHAGQPLATDDADVKAARECEWETSATRERTPGEPATTAWTTQLGCGIGFGTELTVGGGRTRGDGDPATLWSLSGKTALSERGESTPGLALAWAVLADQSPGVPPKAHGWLVSVVASQPLAADWTAHLNLGMSHDRPTQRDRFSWAVGVEHTLSDAFDLTAETFGVGADDPSAALGLRWNAHKRVVVGLAWTHDFSPARARAVTLTTTWAF